MSAPEPEADGLRRYGRWAGNPKGMIERPERCIEQVWGNGRGAMASQCSRPRGHGPDGLWCKQHTPDAKAARAKKQDERYRAYTLGFECKFAFDNIARTAIAFFAQKASFDDLEKAVTEYERLATPSPDARTR